MTINNSQAYMENVWDWGILNGCFGDTKIAVSDLDGIVERHGYFLVLESKSIGAQVTGGQQHLFNAMLRNGAFSILVVWGPRNTPHFIQRQTAREISPVEPCDLAGLRVIVTRWYRWADQQPRR